MEEEARHEAESSSTRKPPCRACHQVQWRSSPTAQGPACALSTPEQRGHEILEVHLGRGGGRGGWDGAGEAISRLDSTVHRLWGSLRRSALSYMQWSCHHGHPAPAQQHCLSRLSGQRPSLPGAVGPEHPSLPLQHTLWGRALTFPGLALPDQEGPAVVARSEQQLLCLLPADALVQPPGWAVGVGRAVPRWLPEQGGSTSRPGDGDRWGGPTAKPVGCRAQHLASILCSVRRGDAGPGHPARLATSPSSAPRLSVSNGTSGPGTVAGVWPQGQSLLL